MLKVSQNKVIMTIFSKLSQQFNPLSHHDSQIDAKIYLFDIKEKLLRLSTFVLGQIRRCELQTYSMFCGGLTDWELEGLSKVAV